MYNEPSNSISHLLSDTVISGLKAAILHFPLPALSCRSATGAIGISDPNIVGLLLTPRGHEIEKNTGLQLSKLPLLPRINVQLLCSRITEFLVRIQSRTPKPSSPCL